MKQRTLPQFARVIALVFAVSATIIAAPTPKTIHPPSNANAPVLIAVLADHYLSSEEQEFNYDVENFFTFGLLEDTYFKGRAADLKIVSLFDPTPPNQASIYDFDIKPGVGNCPVINVGDAAGKISTALGGLHPTHTIVLGNYPYNFGCTDGEWTYVAVDAVGTDVIQHEFGHILAELFDEWSLPENKNRNYPDTIAMTDTRNCWQKPAARSPHWKRSGKFPKAKEYPECALFGQRIVHPFEFCRMGTRHEHHDAPRFCEVCSWSMDKTFWYYRDPLGWLRAHQRDPNGWVDPPARPLASHDTTPRFGIVNAAFVGREREQDPVKPVPILRFAVKINPQTGEMTPTGRRTAATGTYVPSYRRLGRFAFEYVVNGKTVEWGVIPDHLFQARGYRGGAAHRNSADQTVEVVIALPNEDLKTIGSGTRELMLYRIPADVTAPFITLDNIEAFRSQKPKPVAVK